MIKKLIKKIPQLKKIILERDTFKEENKHLKIKNNKLNLELIDLKNTIINQENIIENTKIKIDNINKLISNNEEKILILKNTINDKNEIIAKNNIEIERLYYDIKSLNENHIKIADFNSGDFWENIYKNNGNSGTGSYNRLAEFKAKTVNSILQENDIKTTIELGCGDGNQLSLINYKEYTGIDVSKTIIEKNREKFKEDLTKKFFTTNDREEYINNKYDLSISMDVIFHLLEQSTFESYMKDLFSLSKKLVLIYSSNHEEYTKWPEYRHRNFTKYIMDNFSDWNLEKYIPNQYPYIIGKEDTTSSSDFYIFKNIEG